MGAFTLEILAQGGERVQYLGIYSHVHKYLERFVYQDRIDPSSVPICYFETRQLDSARNVHLTDRTYALAQNSLSRVESDLSWEQIETSGYSSPYREIEATDVSIVDASGEMLPLFSRHDLPAGTVQAELYRVVRGHRHRMGAGYQIDLDRGALYTNYRNWFDPDTGAHQLFWVVSADDQGEVTHALLDLKPVAKQASWEDVDPETGILTTTYPVYTREQSTDGYSFRFNGLGPWWVRPHGDSLIEPLMPSGRTPGEGWHVRFRSGEFTTLVHGQLLRYRIPEFDYQGWSPYKPYVYSPYREMWWVNPRVLKATREHLAVKPSERLHFQLFIEDADGVLLRVLTTDTSLDGTLYGDTGVRIEGDKIASYDNAGGFIGFQVDLNPGWRFYASYYYEARDYEYPGLSLNPFDNQDALRYQYVYYLVPDVVDEERALHTLMVDQDGTIVTCSQGKLTGHPSLQPLDETGAPNPNSAVGLTYEDFLVRFSTQQENDHGFYVLCEASFVDAVDPEDVFVADLRRKGGTLLDATRGDAYRANPRLLQSRHGYGEQGQSVPFDAAVLIRPPLSLLVDYGGQLRQDEAEVLLRQFLPAATYGVIDWQYPKSDTEVVSEEAGVAEITFTYEGAYQYRLYRKQEGDWEIVESWDAPSPEVDADSRSVLQFRDEGLPPGEHYRYGVRVVEGDVEYPFGTTVEVEVHS